MGKAFNTVEEMQSYMDKMAYIVVGKVAKTMTDKLKEFIDEDVYSYPEIWGGRTGDFGESWNFTEPMLVNGFIESIISEDLSMIPFDGEWSHGSNYGTDWGNYNLAEIINSGLSTSNFGFPAIEKRPFWYDFEKWSVENFESLFMKECAEVGITMNRSLTFR